MNLIDIFKSGISNYRTTIVGALLGTLNQMVLVGVKMPSSPTEALATIMTAAYIFLGLLAKDSVTGSQPANIISPPPAPAKQGAAVDPNLNPIPGTGHVTQTSKFDPPKS